MHALPFFYAAFVLSVVIAGGTACHCHGPSLTCPSRAPSA
jgi:hypothetical protein